MHLRLSCEPGGIWDLLEDNDDALPSYGVRAELKKPYLFQNYALFPDMSVRQNILAGMHNEKNREKKLDELDRVSRFFHLENVLDSKPHELSGGEAQRTALARMIVNGPDIMLFDEPFSALDVYLREEIRAEFISIMDMLGKDYVIVTHSMDEAYSLIFDDIYHGSGQGNKKRQDS